jgi:lipoyl(octanoyl) transferase
MTIQFRNLGTLAFDAALERQSLAVQKIARGLQEETVWFLEHPSVFTMGRRGSDGNLLTDEDFDGKPLKIVRINRGGDITYHGPGQLVGYPHLDLRTRGRDLFRYLRGLEECLIQAADFLGVEAFQRPGLTGVWTNQGKLASIGVGVRQWITMHGFALNVNTDLRYFRLINPCGMPECPVTSLQNCLGGPVEMDQVREAVEVEFRKVFE